VDAFGGKILLGSLASENCADLDPPYIFNTITDKLKKEIEIFQEFITA
jgi:hypothetical protein